MKKAGRNDPCPCGSGKKFKKCCESLMLGGRFKAKRIDSLSAPQIQKTVGLASFFQARLAETPVKPPMPEPTPTFPSVEAPSVIVNLEEKAGNLIS